MLVCPGDRAVHAHLPHYLARCVGLHLRVGQQPIPGPIAPPAGEAAVAPLPRATARTQVTPGRPSPYPPQDAVYDLAMVLPLFAAPASLGQERRDPLPGLVPQLATSRHRSESPLISDLDEGRG